MTMTLIIGASRWDTRRQDLYRTSHLEHAGVPELIVITFMAEIAYVVICSGEYGP